MKELTVLVYGDRLGAESPEPFFASEERIEVRSAGSLGALLEAVKTAEGRYIKILWDGETLLTDSLEQVLTELEQSEADVFITGCREVHPSAGTSVDHTPFCSCVRRQIDMIKLAEKYEKVKDCLDTASLCFDRSFLNAVLEKAGVQMLSSKEAFSTLPFIHAESIYIIPEILCEYNSEIRKTPTIPPETIKYSVDYYESVKPIGKSRDEFLRKRLSRIVVHQYVYLITSGADKKSGREEAARFRRDLMENAPLIAKITEKKYRVLRRLGHYKSISQRALNEG